MNMEKAVIFGNLAYTFPREIVNDFRSMQGVTEAELIFGCYDFYLIVQVETEEKLTETALRVRFTKGVINTMTCRVVNASIIRPELEAECIPE